MTEKEALDALVAAQDAHTAKVLEATSITRKWADLQNQADQALMETLLRYGEMKTTIAAVKAARLQLLGVIAKQTQDTHPVPSLPVVA